MVAFISESWKLRLLHLSFVVARPMTLGVRRIVDQRLRGSPAGETRLRFRWHFRAAG